MAAASFARSLRPYVWYARLAFQRRAAYRLANLTGITVNFFFFLIQAQVYFAFFAGRADVAGWSAPDAVLYFATSESLLMVLGAMPILADNHPAGDVELKPLPLDQLFDGLRFTGYGHGQPKSAGCLWRRRFHRHLARGPLWAHVERGADRIVGGKFVQ